MDQFTFRSWQLVESIFKRFPSNGHAAEQPNMRGVRGILRGGRTGLPSFYVSFAFF